MSPAQKKSPLNRAASRKQFPTSFILLLLAVMLDIASISRGEIFVDQTALDESLARATNFPSVVAFAGLRSNVWYAGGSGVAISVPGKVVGTKWIVCSGHQIKNFNYDAIDIAVKNTGNTGNTVVERVRVSRAIVHPQYSPTTGSGVDLALLYLTNALTSITPAVIYTQALPAQIVMHQCGFGRYGVAGEGSGTYDGAKRAGCNFMGDISSPLIESQYLMCKFTDPHGSRYQQGEWQLSDLDSGGGGFVLESNHYYFAASLCFFGVTGNWDIGSSSGVLPIQPYLGWIYDTIAAVEQPSLKLQQLDNATLKLSWPSAASEFVLQTQGTLTTTNWTDAGLTASDDGTNWSVIVTNAGPSRFWRLAKQPGPAGAGLRIHGPASVLQPASKLTADPMWDDLMPHVPVPER